MQEPSISEPVPTLHASCGQRGASLQYAPGQGALRCTCIAVMKTASITHRRHSVEHDYSRNPRRSGATTGTHQDSIAIDCTSCGASFRSKYRHPFRAVSILWIARGRQDGHAPSVTGTGPVTVQGSPREQARTTFQKWLHGLWFAPDKLRRAATDASRRSACMYRTGPMTPQPLLRTVVSAAMIIRSRKAIARSKMVARWRKPASLPRPAGPPVSGHHRRAISMMCWCWPVSRCPARSPNVWNPVGSGAVGALSRGVFKRLPKRDVPDRSGTGLPSAPVKSWPSPSNATSAAISAVIINASAPSIPATTIFASSTSCYRYGCRPSVSVTEPIASWHHGRSGKVQGERPQRMENHVHHRAGAGAGTAGGGWTLWQHYHQPRVSSTTPTLADARRAVAQPLRPGPQSRRQNRQHSSACQTRSPEPDHSPVPGECAAALRSPRPRRSPAGPDCARARQWQGQNAIIRDRSPGRARNSDRFSAR